jgi:hypothetical protein
LIDENSIRQKVIEYVNRHSIPKRFNHKKMVEELGIDPIYYAQHKQYFWNLISDARTNYENRQGLKSLNFHNWRGFIFALKSLDRELAVSEGKWLQTTARNHMLTFKNDLGRLEWHMNGRINIWVKKPVVEAKVMRLLACAFYENGLVYDIHIFHQWAKTLKMKGVHCAIDTGEKLPYLKFEGFAKTNGTTLLLGDKSHPTCAELVINYPDWAERNEAMIESTKQMLVTVMSGFSAQSEKFIEQQKQFTETLASLNGATKSKPVTRGFYE